MVTLTVRTYSQTVVGTSTTFPKTLNRRLVR